MVNPKTLFQVAALLGLCAVLANTADAATYYVRPDGGTATQCTGMSDAKYPGSGSAQACAFSHPNWALSPVGNNPTKMAGGDTLIIDGSNSAQYLMGFGGPNATDTSYCHASWPWGCYMRPVPSGPSAAQPTRILGKGFDSGCATPPQLWGNERSDRVLNLQGSSNVEMQCLEVTDHSDCQEFGPNACKRDGSAPYGMWASKGMVASDSANVLIKNVNIHGMAHHGVHAARLKDWTLEDSKIVANSFVGWDGDMGDGTSSNSGTITFTRVTIAYNGCGETFPGLKPYNCYSQDQGGYGDGLGTQHTDGNWVFNNVDISHNVSDGLDLLYHTGNGVVTIKRSRFEGNAGNQAKVAGNSVIENSVLIGNCAYFKDNPVTWNSATFNNCRAGGNPIHVVLENGQTSTITNSTVTSNGDTIITSKGTTCNGSEKITSRNNVFLGGTEFNDGFDKSALYYAAGATGNSDGPCGVTKFDDDYSVIYGTKFFSTDCSGKSSSKCMDPKFMEPAVVYYKGDAFDFRPQSASPAVASGLVITGASLLDYLGNDRGSKWDIGAVQYGAASTAPATTTTDPVVTSPAPTPAPTVTPVDGVCSNAMNACAAGSMSDTADSATSYLWSCVGTDGGSTASCSMPMPVNGACSAALNTCTTGSMSDIADNSTNYLWSCVGANGGTTASCSLAIPVPTTTPTAVNGVCGATKNTCTVGSFKDKTDSKIAYLWSCAGSNGGTTASCSAAIPTTKTSTKYRLNWR